MFRPGCCLLQPSRWLQALFLLLVCSALLAIGLTAMPVWVKVPLAVAVVIHGVCLLRRYGRLSHPLSVLAVYWDECGWQLRLRNGEKLDVQPGRQRFPGRQWLLLEFFSADGRYFPLPLVADAVAHDESEPRAGGVATVMRRLRVCLIHGTEPSDALQPQA